MSRKRPTAACGTGRPAGEPRLWAGSRRGVPYHSKISAALRGETPGACASSRPQAVRRVLERHAELDFRAHLWPLIAKEAGYGYYRELFTGSPGDRHRSAGWAEFSSRFAELDWYSPGREELVAAAVPDPALRLDLEALDRPFAGRRCLPDLPTSRRRWRTTSNGISRSATARTIRRRWPSLWRC